MDELIAAEWQSYLTEVVPKDASTVQITETRRAFYSGALAFFNVLANKVSPGVEPTKADMALMNQLKAELNDFAAKVASGRA